MPLAVAFQPAGLVPLGGDRVIGGPDEIPIEGEGLLTARSPSHATMDQGCFTRRLAWRGGRLGRLADRPGVRDARETPRARNWAPNAW